MCLSCYSFFCKFGVFKNKQRGKIACKSDMCCSIGSPFLQPPSPVFYSSHTLRRTHSCCNLSSFPHLFSSLRRHSQHPPCKSRAQPDGCPGGPQALCLCVFTRPSPHHPAGASVEHQQRQQQLMPAEHPLCQALWPHQLHLGLGSLITPFHRPVHEAHTACE